LELLEDAFWESSYSAFSHDDYLNILQNAKDHEFFKKQEELFNTVNRNKKFKSALLSKPLFRDLTTQTNLSSLPVFSEDSILNSELLSPNNFFNFSNEVGIDTFEDNYDNFKFLNFIHHLNYKTLLQLKSSPIYPLSYAQVLDTFRADYEENAWYLNDVDTENTYLTSNNLDDSNLRVSNSMKLRSSTRSAIVTYNAIQKVFKSRLDEGRSNTRLQDFSNSYVSHPFITEKKSPYEGMLSKNTNSFFNVNNYKDSLIPIFNQNTAV
jgi:hypothetical protein